MTSTRFKNPFRRIVDVHFGPDVAIMVAGEDDSAAPEIIHGYLDPMGTFTGLMAQCGVDRFTDDISHNIFLGLGLPLVHHGDITFLAGYKFLITTDGGTVTWNDLSIDDATITLTGGGNQASVEWGGIDPGFVDGVTYTITTHR